MKKLVLLLLPLFLFSCGEDVDSQIQNCTKEEKKFDSSMSEPSGTSGQKITIDNSNIKTYFNIDCGFTYYVNRDTDYTKRIIYSASISGNKKLSYFVSNIIFEFTYQCMDDKGEYYTSKYSLTLTPSSIGADSFSRSVDTEYRSIIKDSIQLSKLESTGGYIVFK